MNKLPQLALIGHGAWGSNHARVMRELDMLRWVHDANRDALHDVPERTAFIEKIWDDERTTGVVIATPPHTHAELAITALRAGKHVLVEKPMAMNVADCARMEIEAQAMKRVLMVGHLMRFHEGYHGLLEDVGNAGRIEYAYSHRLQPGRVRSDMSCLWSLAPHDVDMLIGLLGVPMSVVCAPGMTRQPGLADIIMATLEWASGARGHIFISWAHPAKQRELTVIGEYGACVMNQESADEPLKAELLHFMGRMEGCEPLSGTTPADGFNVVRVLAACDDSTRQGGQRVCL